MFLARISSPQDYQSRGICRYKFIISVLLWRPRRITQYPSDIRRGTQHHIFIIITSHLGYVYKDKINTGTNVYNTGKPKKILLDSTLNCFYITYHILTPIFRWKNIFIKYFIPCKWRNYRDLLVITKQAIAHMIVLLKLLLIFTYE